MVTHLGLVLPLRVLITWFETALGGYSSALISAWSPPDDFDQSAASRLVPDHPNVWTDGSLVLDKVAGISSSGAGFFAHQSDHNWSARTWGQVDRLHSVDGSLSCRGFCSVPGPLQSVQRAEMWGVISCFAILWCFAFGC